MYESRHETNTEETFILASLKEFVKLWGSGCQANFQLQCFNGQVSYNFSAQLGAPADRHFVPHPHHGFHAPRPLPPRRKSPQQRKRDRTRAAAHRASKTVKMADTDSSVENLQYQDVNQVTADPADAPPPPQSQQEADPADGPPPLQPQQEADTATSHSSNAQAVPAAQTIPNHTAAAAVPLLFSQAVAATISEVRDEVVSEHSEVKVYATGVFENCPDNTLTEDYYVSLRKFVMSEPHLQDNIASVKMTQLSSRQLGPQLFVHFVKVEISVKTARLWEPPSAYIKKHLANNDWLKGNKTRITLMKIQ